MSELTITLLRLGYLALLWVFVLSSIAVGPPRPAKRRPSPRRWSR